MNNTFILVLFTILVLSIASGTILSFYTLLTGKDIQKESKKETRTSIDPGIYNILLQDKLVDKINNVIDSMIRDQANVYQLMVLSTNEMSVQYLNTEEQDKMQKYLTHITCKHISPEVKNLMNLIYNIKDDEDLKNIVSLRVKIYLIHFVVEYNKDIE